MQSHPRKPPPPPGVEAEDDFDRLLADHVTGDLVMQVARSNEDLEAIQRLRYQVFTEEMQVHFPDAVDGLDCDRFDPWCEHLLVKERSSGRVVGTYRILTPENARRAGGYYSATEFDLSSLGAIAGQCAEVGRSCIHPAHRTGAVIMLLWGGVIERAMRGGFRYLLGCASVSLLDGGAAAAKVWRVAQASLQQHPDDPRVVPLNRYPVEKLHRVLPARVPPLIKGYLNLGARICGEPAWDPDFNAADFPVLLDFHNMDARYRKHFGLV